MSPDEGGAGSRRRLLAAAAAAVLVPGCATVAPPPPDAPATSTPLPPVAGRFALRLTDAGGAVRSSAARFEAAGDETDGTLSVFSPLGTTIAQARWRGAAVELATPLETRRFASMESLAQAVFGESLPLQALMHWLRGQPWPRAPHRPGPAGFEQLGWTVDTARRTEGALVATRATPSPAVELRVRLDPPQP